MGATSVLTHAVTADLQDSPIGEIYVVGGVGASGLHAKCIDNFLPVSPLVEGCFFIERNILQRELNEASDINRVYICTAIKRAARGIDVGAAR